MSKQSIRKNIEKLREESKLFLNDKELSPELRFFIKSIFSLIDIIVVVLLEKKIRKDSSNSGLPPSQGFSGNGNRNKQGEQDNSRRGSQLDNSRTKKTEETLSPKECSNCGADLKGEDATKIDQRKKIDIIYEIVETTFTAETKECPDCGEKTKVDFPEGIDGKVQYGNGIKASIINFLTGAGSLLRQSAQKNLNRIIELVKQRMPEKFKPLNEEFPELLDHIIKLSYFEASDLFNPPISQDKSNAIKQILDQFFLYLEKSKDNNMLNDFIRNTIDFDSISRAIEFANLDREGYFIKIIENLDHISSSSKHKLLNDRDIHLHLERRNALAAAFSKTPNPVSGPHTKKIIEIIESWPGSIKKLSPLDEANKRIAENNTRIKTLEKRAYYWFESFKNITSREERVKFAFQKIASEFGSLKYSHLDKIFDVMARIDHQLIRTEYFLSYIQFIKEKDIERGLASFSESSKKDIYFMFNSMFRGIKTIEDISKFDHIPELNSYKLDIIKIRTEIYPPSPLQDAMIDYLFEAKGSDPEILEFFEDENLIEKLYYDSSKKKYAIYQLNQKYKLSSMDIAFQERLIKPPGVRQERKIISEVQQTLDRQFPQNSYIKNEVLDYIEKSLRTSQVEARALNSSRVNFSNWSETPELVAIDFPDVISSNMQSSFDRKQLLEYLIGHDHKIPRFVHNMEVFLNDDLDIESGENILKEFKRRFTQSNQIVRSIIIQPLLDKQIGILSEQNLVADIDKIILGDKYNEPIIKRLFESYLNAVPETEQEVIYSYIMSSFVDSPPRAKGASLKTILEAMGPFGVKAGQFLSTSGLLPIEYSRELRDFLSNALPPSRARVISDLEDGLGLELRGIITIDDQLGSGSINYVQGVTAEIDGNQVDAVVRIRRDYIEGVVANESDIWSNVVEDLRSSGNLAEKNIADIVEEARRQSMSTLATHGAELDLSIERGNFSVAQQTYGVRFNDGTLSGWEVKAASPINELQELIDPQKQKLFSFYEKFNHIPLENISDGVMREELAKAIINAELNALFENGVYDPDGHPGNWLIDLDKKQIVRIDYAQLRKTPENERIAFKNIFSELIKTRPNFSSVEAAKQLALLLDVDMNKEGLVRAIQLASRKMSFGLWGNPQEKLFALRNAIQAELPESIRARVNLSDTLRSAIASLGKVSGFAEYLPRSSYLALLDKYTRVPRIVHIAARWNERLKSITSTAFTSDRAEVSNNRVGPNHTQLPRGLSETYERGVPSSQKSIDNEAELNIQRSTSIDSEQKVENARYFTEINFNDWKPEHSDSIFEITAEEYEKLPNGTELYYKATGGKHIKGVHGIPAPFDGITSVGVAAFDYREGGGPRIVRLIAGPPRGLDLSQNPYYTAPDKARIILLRPDQLSEIPDGTVLFSSSGTRFIKGADEVNNIEQKEIMGFLPFGFPDADQVGFEDFGVSLSAQANINANALPQSARIPNRSTTEGCIQNSLVQLLNESMRN